MGCEMCGGVVLVMGALGKVIHGRCIACGWVQEVDPADIEGLDEEEE